MPPIVALPQQLVAAIASPAGAQVGAQVRLQVGRHSMFTSYYHDDVTDPF
jgi:hypothetical protein